jgi:hypothetical protein|tara:strand:- start:169 stop:453 length:285 start_codon:yes stop_codon:yes gene_type:complete
MISAVHIPKSISGIKNAIARKVSILAEWQKLLARSRKNSLRASRQLQATATREQITELQNALAIAIEEKKHQEAVAFVARLAPLRKDFLNGLFD